MKIKQFSNILILIIICIAIQNSSSRFWVNVRNQRSQCWNSQSNTGVTWALSAQVVTPAGLVQVGCNSCDAYKGDTSCEKCLPILCIEKLNASRPAYDLTTAQNPFYHGWSGGNVKLSDPVQGTQLTSLAVANQFCQQQFGSNWVMADHHDGKYINGMNAANWHSTSSPAWNWAMANTGGWTFFAFGDYDEIKKQQDQTNCGCESSHYYRWDATISPPGWVYNPIFNNFCNKCENLPSTLLPEFCFGENLDLGDVSLPDYGCFACFCRPCDVLYYWSYSEHDDKWKRIPALDSFCKGCFDNQAFYNDVCHWENPFFSPAADAPCEGCWCDSCDKWRAFSKKSDADGTIVTKEETDADLLKRCENCPNNPWCFYSLLDFVNSKYTFGCICNANLVTTFKCDRWNYMTQNPVGTWQSMLDNSSCNECNNPNPPVRCYTPGITWNDIKDDKTLKEACICLD